MTCSSLADLLERAHHQSAQPIQLGLDRVMAALTEMDNPQHNLNVVHVAGTNGKGSVLAFLEAMLRQAGCAVGLYTSPHLHRINERIRINGRAIPDDALGLWLERVLQVSAGRSLTFFELLTVVALCHFRDQGLGRNNTGRQGMVLLETGLGGRLDATNVVLPQLSIITHIAIDHTDYLGSTLTAIATEKAGIFKPAVPAVAAAGHPEVEALLLRQARRVGTPLRLLGRDFTIHTPASATFTDRPSSTRWPITTWEYAEGGESRELPMPGLSGRHQLQNAALAVAGIRRLQEAGWPAGWEAVAAGLREARWPGRLERLPGPDANAAGPTILLDGAHNPAGCAVLADFLRDVDRQIQPTVVVFAALQDKQVEAMIHLLAPYAARVWTTQVGGERGRTAESLAACWRATGRPATPCATPAQALAAAYAACPATGQVLVCGSLYLVGAIRALLCPDTETVS
ncbi:MAG: bifunctional folylpolyglutamate synthase/dihydrofolate synthase [Magnetococcus sp. DMHC-8]